MRNKGKEYRQRTRKSLKSKKYIGGAMMASLFKKKEKSIEELRADLERELIGMDMRRSRNELTAAIGSARAAERGKDASGWPAIKGRLFKAGNFLKDEITFYGNNVRDNIEKEQGKGKGKKKGRNFNERDDFKLVGDLV